MGEGLFPQRAERNNDDTKITPESVGAKPATIQENLDLIRDRGLRARLAKRAATLIAREALDTLKSAHRKPPAVDAQHPANETNPQAELFGSVEQREKERNESIPASDGNSEKVHSATRDQNPQLNLDLGDEKQSL